MDLLLSGDALRLRQELVRAGSGTYRSSSGGSGSGDWLIATPGCCPTTPGTPASAAAAVVLRSTPAAAATPRQHNEAQLAQAVSLLEELGERNAQLEEALAALKRCAHPYTLNPSLVKPLRKSLAYIPYDLNP